MTPKEKAKELYHKYADEFNFDDTYRGYREQSKQCALIAVDEIMSLMIKFHNRHIEDNSNEIYFWEEVKNELNKQD